MAAKNPKIIVIGGGVIGCFIALELSRHYPNIMVIERCSSLTSGRNQSLNNSGVLHSGINYDKATRPLKAELCVCGNPLLYEFCRRHRVPCRQNGKLMVAIDQTEEKALQAYFARAKDNQVPGVRILSAKQIRKIEPNIRATAALWIPSAGVLSPAVLMTALINTLRQRGVHMARNQNVRRLESQSDGRVRLDIQGSQGRMWQTADWVINAAGVVGVALARSLGPGLDIKTALLRGDSYKFRNRVNTCHGLNGTSIYPTPIQVRTPTGTHHTVGVHLTPIWGNDSGQSVLGRDYLIGPRLTSVNHEEDFQTPPPPPEDYLAQMPFYNALVPTDLHYFHGAMQARLDGYQDFYIKRDRRAEMVIHLLGIDSPGLTSAPAIARFVLKMMAD